MRSLTPNLEALVNWTRDQGEKEDGLEREARREFRALKAVAMAAERDGSPDCLCDTCKAVARLKRLGEQSKKETDDA